MIAYKTFAQCPTNQKPEGIPNSIVWQQVAIPLEKKEEYELQGFIVISESDYIAYVASHAGELNTYLSTKTAELTKNAIIKKITSYQLKAPMLINDLMATNTMMGISTKQSDQMFDDYYDVLLRLSWGAFPTALNRLLLKRPNGFVTQSLIDKWTQMITEAML